jgi:hypothetical protein
MKDGPAGALPAGPFLVRVSDPAEGKKGFAPRFSPGAGR